jgi:hypothetical protein
VKVGKARVAREPRGGHAGDEQPVRNAHWNVPHASFRLTAIPRCT